MSGENKPMNQFTREIMCLLSLHSTNLTLDIFIQDISSTLQI